MLPIDVECLQAFHINWQHFKLISFCLNNQRKMWKVTNWCGMLASIPHRLVTFQNFHWWKGNVKCYQLMWNVLVSIPHQLVTSPIFLWLTWKHIFLWLVRQNDILKCYQLMWNAYKHSTSIGNIWKKIIIPYWLKDDFNKWRHLLPDGTFLRLDQDKLG